MNTLRRSWGHSYWSLALMFTFQWVIEKAVSPDWLNSCTPRITPATQCVGSKWGNLQDGRDSETRIRGHPVTRKNGWSKAAFQSECGPSSPQKVFLKYASRYGAEKGISSLPFLLPLPSLPQLLFPVFTDDNHRIAQACKNTNYSLIPETNAIHTVHKI